MDLCGGVICLNMCYFGGVGFIVTSIIWTRFAFAVFGRSGFGEVGLKVSSLGVLI